MKKLFELHDLENSAVMNIRLPWDIKNENNWEKLSDILNACGLLDSKLLCYWRLNEGSELFQQNSESLKINITKTYGKKWYRKTVYYDVEITFCPKASLLALLKLMKKYDDTLTLSIASEPKSKTKIVLNDNGHHDYNSICLDKGKHDTEEIKGKLSLIEQD